MSEEHDRSDNRPAPTNDDDIVIREFSDDEIDDIMERALKREQQQVRITEDQRAAMRRRTD